MKLKESIDKYINVLDKNKKSVVKGDLDQYRDYLITISSAVEKSDFIIVEDINESLLIDFVGEYLMRKVKLSEENFISVLENFRDFFKFMVRKQDISYEKGNKFIKIINYYIDVLPDLKRFEYKLKAFIEIDINSLHKIEKIKSSLVTIDRIENNNLWLNSMADRGIIGPFVVPKEICDFARKGFSFECEYAKTGNKYHFTFISNIYPEGINI